MSSAVRPASQRTEARSKRRRLCSAASACCTACRGRRSGQRGADAGPRSYTHALSRPRRRSPSHTARRLLHPAALRDRFAGPPQGSTHDASARSGDVAAAGRQGARLRRVQRPRWADAQGAPGRGEETERRDGRTRQGRWKQQRRSERPVRGEQGRESGSEGCDVRESGWRGVVGSTSARRTLRRRMQGPAAAEPRQGAPSLQRGRARGAPLTEICARWPHLASAAAASMAPEPTPWRAIPTVLAAAWLKRACKSSPCHGPSPLLAPFAPV
jgi:hypothetical protein